MNIDIFSLMPEIVVAFFAFLILMAGVFIGKRFEKATAPLAALGLIAAIGSVLWFNVGRLGLFYNYTYSIESFSIFFKIFAILTSLIIVGLSPYYINKTERIKNHISEYYFLVLLITIGTTLILPKIMLKTDIAAMLITIHLEAA